MKLLRCAAMSIGACALAGLVHACTIVNGLAVPERDAGLDSCAHARIPPPTASVNIPGGSLLAAVRSVDFGNGDGGVNEVGYDLDNACTCLEGANAEGTCIATGPECDIDRAHGRDNNAAFFVQGIAAKVGIDLQRRINASIANGGSTLLIELDDLGGPNDSTVYVSLIPSLGTGRLADGGDLPNAAPPAFDETDHWWIPPVIDGGGASSVVMATGYVADGVLVVGPFARFEMHLPGDFVIKVNDGYLTANIDRSGPKPKVTRGVLTGRWPVVEVFRVIGRMLDPKSCATDLSALPDLVTTVCSGADLTASHADDGKGKQCDAISIAIAFEAYTPGNVVEGTVPVVQSKDPCADASFRCPPID